MKRWGVLCGMIAGWGLLVAAGEAVRRLDPASRNPFTAMNDYLWFWGGWVLELVYCLPFWLMKGWLSRRKAAKDAARERAG